MERYLASIIKLIATSETFPVAFLLNSYRPLIRTSAGRAAALKHGIPPFIDGSCRREPDFEATLPGLSAICRFRRFAPRVNEGDVVLYVTVKGKYPGQSARVWRMVALLRVIKAFPTHGQAATWYRGQGLALPNNCLVPGNPPFPLDRTDASLSSVTLWDRMYRKKAAACSVFRACEPLYRELHSPPIITEEMMVRSFGRVPVTRTPPVVPRESITRLFDLCRIPMPDLD